MKKLLFFSFNSGKIKEIKNLFGIHDINIHTPKEFNLNYSPKENGSSFAENAKIKSFYGYQKLLIPSFADDSGICIEALGWKPNILSRRFLENFANDKDCFRYILKKVEKSKKFKAYFKTSICITLKENYHIVFEGKVNGRISNKVLGNNGFGYDPIFIPEGQTKTYGEISNKSKNLSSHRSSAIKKLISFLVN